MCLVFVMKINAASYYQNAFTGHPIIDPEVFQQPLGWKHVGMYTMNGIAAKLLRPVSVKLGVLYTTRLMRCLLTG